MPFVLKNAMNYFLICVESTQEDKHMGWPPTRCLFFGQSIITHAYIHGYKNSYERWLSLYDEGYMVEIFI